MVAAPEPVFFSEGGGGSMTTSYRLCWEERGEEERRGEGLRDYYFFFFSWGGGGRALLLLKDFVGRKEARRSGGGRGCGTTTSFLFSWGGGRALLLFLEFVGRKKARRSGGGTAGLPLLFFFLGGGRALLRLKDLVGRKKARRWLFGRVKNCRAGNPRTWNHQWTQHQLTKTLYHSKGLDQRSGSNPLERSGSEVWIECRRVACVVICDNAVGCEAMCLHNGAWTHSWVGSNFEVYILGILMQRVTLHLGGRRCAHPPNPPPAFFHF